ncbi:MAG: ribonuclease D [Pseudomonadota bacterium]|nr:ribonuclease D [Pseudomonadota bacterium]
MNDHSDFIQHPEALEAWCDHAKDRACLALDTEFIREKTYYPQLCLIQAATDQAVACIDPLALPTLEPLLELFTDERIVKILHSGTQDMEIFHQLAPAHMPRPIFDTQLAAALLGYGHQVGYGRLVEQRLGIQLTKHHTRSDWCRRPLSAEELAYAEDDVRYLVPLYETLSSELRERGRMDWLKADFAALSDPDRYQTRPAEAWQRIGRSHRLKPRQLGALRALAEWRESLAQRINRPRQWIVKDESLVDLAQRLPKGIDDMTRIRGIQAKLLSDYGSTLLELISEGAEKPLEVPNRGKVLDEDQQSVVDILSAVVRKKGVELDISPALLATRRELEALVDGQRDIPVLQGWRSKAVGEILTATLAGQRQLAIKDQELQILAPDGAQTPTDSGTGSN